MSWHLPAGYVENVPPRYCSDLPDVREGRVVTWQPDVYPFAAQEAEGRGLTKLIDLGCGRASKLVALAGRLDLVGVDIGLNLEWCERLHGDAARWVEVDLETMKGAEFIDTEGALVVSADVVEHLVDPSAYLHWIHDSGLPAVLSTPDRELSNRRPLGPPPSTHVREWTLAEFTAVLADFDLPVTWVDHTRANDAVAKLKTTMVVIR